MIKQTLTSPAAAPAIGPYSPAVQTERLVFFSGQVPFDSSGAVVGETAADQARQALAAQRPVSEIEEEVLGVNHSELGALYLERHRLPELMVNAVRFHHRPEEASNNQLIIASVQIADLLMRNAQIGQSGNYMEVTHERCLEASGRKVLFPNTHDAEQAIARASFNRSLERLPHILEGLV